MSGRAIRIRRKNSFNLFREASRLSSFDDFPLLRPEVDPQLHASRNEVDQPFWLSCEKDSVLAQMSGASRVAFREGPVRHFDTAIGEFVYVPAGTFHRIHVVEPGIMLRYKAQEIGSERIGFFCDDCGDELSGLVWDSSAPVQLGYAEAIDRFNADELLRTCGTCGKEHTQIDADRFRWRAVAAAISADDDDDDD